MRLTLFEKDEDYLAFERVLAESLGRPDAPRLLAYCLMPNHWHIVVRAGKRTNLSTWMQWVTVTHTHRWHAHYHTTGEGPLYQGRFKSFPVQQDGHFLTVCRYVEANALRAKLAARAERWRWCSLWVRRNRGLVYMPGRLASGRGTSRSELKRWLTAWPVDRPRNWLAKVNQPMDEPSLQTVRESIARAVPLGTERWKGHIAARLGLGITLRPRGRPRKKAIKSS